MGDSEKETCSKSLDMQIPDPTFQLKGPEAIRSRMEEIRARMGTQNRQEFSQQLQKSTGNMSGLIGKPPEGGDELHPLDPYASNLMISNGGTVDKLQIQSMIDKVAREQNIDVNLLRAVVEAESDFNTNEVSNKGAKGLMQLMPETMKELGVTNPFDAYQNLTGGAKYLKQMLSRYEGNAELALAAYNAGPGNVDKAGGVPNFAETKQYVEKILRRIGAR
jgi:soluble lytic murein transglycosylase-like protein